MSIHAAMQDACRAVGIKPPRQAVPGRWAVTDTEARNGKGDGRVKLDDDGKGGCAWNHQTGQHMRFREAGIDGTPTPIKRDPEKERRREAEQRELEASCARIVRACEVATHPYLARKGFPQELGLVIDSVRPHLPAGELGEGMAFALPDGEGPFLIIPGRIGNRVSTVQIITPEGEKKNIKGGIMGGASHRIATGPRLVVAEGIATALTVRAALRLLGAPATVLCAFAANNVGRVAGEQSAHLIAADHDKPQPSLHGMGAGEYYARQSGRPWIMPPMEGEDFNDWHTREGLRAVAVHLRGVLRS